MWFGVETAFVDGKHFASRPLFDQNIDPNEKRVQKGTCYTRAGECPHNSSQSFLGGRIEVRTDWFQTKEQALDFCEGKITYIVHQKAGTYRFLKWEAIPVGNGLEPFKGIYKNHP